MILPIRTSIRPNKTPYANYALIAVNIVIFALTYYPHKDPFTGAAEELRPWAEQFMLIPSRPDLWQFVTYAFLHGGLLHIFGNMFFLYIFGNNVNDKLGHVGYVAFFLVGAVFSGLGHTLLSGSPVLGASGAVAAVTGAYLVLFPQTLITIVYWFFFIGTMEIPALWFIAFKLIFLDNIIARSTANVAYDAHLAGYAAGMLVMMIMLALGLIQTTGFDLWSMLKQWNRRRQFRDVVAEGFDPFESRPARKIKVKEVKTEAQQKKEEKIKQLRQMIADRITQQNLPTATALYLELMAVDPEQILPKQYLLDIANHLTGENKPAESAMAYERFLTHYKNYEYSEQVELMLGLLYARYLKEPQKAKKNLESALSKLSDAGQKKLCLEELNRLKG
ncbi:MAG: rhomboid family intramembrane serine protease [Phycisphaerae bacterium]|nr:rhomboid family intramembrane serine protease [Phycisphaerae bacterium]